MNFWTNFLTSKNHWFGFLKQKPKTLVPTGCQNIKYLTFQLSSLTYSQIWLIILVGDHQCGYITKLGEETHV